FKENKFRMGFITFIYKILPLFVFVSYPVLICYLILTGSAKLLQCITVPLGVFVTVTLIRKFINAQRPYEKLNITPLMNKTTKGKSFPSRHTASGIVIAMAFLYVNPVIGAVYLAVALLISLSRVLSGVHFPRDVAASIVYAVAMSCLFFYVL
ncbi:MAG: phosphatase PAP2 family protein, partial [Lachnospiraceae bacterium]|nr:phosphatase PAP2 family protein [Lachnospiraceae bacterium]